MARGSPASGIQKSLTRKKIKINVNGNQSWWNVFWLSLPGFHKKKKKKNTRTDKNLPKKRFGNSDFLILCFAAEK